MQQQHDTARTTINSVNKVTEVFYFASISRGGIYSNGNSFISLSSFYFYSLYNVSN